MPCELDSRREGSEIGNGPGVAVRAAGADEVAEEMEMEAEEGEQGGGPAVAGFLRLLGFGRGKEEWR